MARARSLQQLRLREHQLFLALTIVVGVLAGLSAVLFTVAIDRTTRVFFGLDPSAVRLFLVPVTVSLATGALLAWVFPDVRGSGVPQTEAAYHLHGGVMPGRVPLGKFVTGVLCIGSGHSMGREGPSVQIGAGLASAVGRWLALPPARVKDLVPVGAAGALAAAFNTPVAAVLFALEEIIGDLNAGLLGSTVVASVASVVVERAILGNEPLFRVPAYHLVHPLELLAYAVLGVAGGIVSLVFCRGLLGLRRAFQRLPGWTRPLQPAVGGVVIGALLLVAPQIMGVGYEHVDQALNGGLVLRTMVALCTLKLVATIVSYSSGNAGGIFAPSLYIGAMAGGAVGTIVHRFAPLQTADPGAYALVGMGTLFAGIIRAPMTSVFMIFEITQDYQILVPLMVANLLSFIISRRFQPVPVYHALLHQDHVHLPSVVAGAPAPWTAADVMRADSRFASTSVDSTFIHAHPDHPSDIVLERLAESGGLLPVVSREDVQQVVGVVTVNHVVRFLRKRRQANGAAPRG
jgi:CIC family chloride channel protein